MSLISIPGAAIAALAIAGVMRRAYGDGPGSDSCKPLALTALVVSLTALALWRILELQSGALNAIDVTLGVLCALLLVRGLKLAWADGPFERTPRNRENTPFMVAVALCFLIGLSLLASFAPVFHPGPTMALQGGTHVDVLPPGNWE